MAIWYACHECTSNVYNYGDTVILVSHIGAVGILCRELGSVKSHPAESSTMLKWLGREFS